MEQLKNKVPTWFWVVAIIGFLWNLMGLFSFYVHTFITDEAKALLPADQQALYDEYPMWITVIFAIAVLFGTIGCIGLLMRKKWARGAFLISLMAIIPQMIHNIFFTSSIDVFGTAQAVTMPILVIVLGAFLLWFAGHSTKKGWLR